MIPLQLPLEGINHGSGLSWNHSAMSREACDPVSLVQISGPPPDACFAAVRSIVSHDPM